MKVSRAWFNKAGELKINLDYEWKSIDRLSGIVSENDGLLYVQQIQDRFTVKSAFGLRHCCFVYSVACSSLQQYLMLARPGDTKVAFQKKVLRAMLRCLDFLHAEARIVHTDFKLDIMMLTTNDDTTETFVHKLGSRRLRGKHDCQNNRIIYESIDFTVLVEFDSLSVGRPLLGDFGDARIMLESGQLDPAGVQPEPLRALEVVLGMEWSTPVDIWSVGIVAWWLFLGRLPFSARADDGSWFFVEHLAQIVGLLGPPSIEFLQRNRLFTTFWNEDRSWKRGTDVVARERKIEEELVGLESIAQMAEFIRATLAWKPEDRKMARELEKHPWLKE